MIYSEIQTELQTDSEHFKFHLTSHLVIWPIHENNQLKKM